MVPLAMFGLVMLAGCGGREENPDHLPTYDVTAKVTVDGKPLPSGALTMTPTDPSLPSSGAELTENGTAKFSTYAPQGGIPAGEYMAGLMMSMETMKPVPTVRPVPVMITEDMEGGEVAIAFEGTGRVQSSPLPATP